MNVLLANEWQRRPAPTALPRWKPEAVFAALPLHFVAHLGHADVDVGELHSLDVGDVILVSQTSKDPMQLLAIDTDLQLHAHLGAHGAQRAAQLMASARGAAR
jgi:flagellar motor switch protein FliM